MHSVTGHLHVRRDFRNRPRTSGANCLPVQQDEQLTLMLVRTSNEFAPRCVTVALVLRVRGTMSFVQFRSVY